MNKYSRQLSLIVFIFLQLPLFSQNLDINLLKSINKKETGFKNNYFKLNTSAVTPLSITIPIGLAIAGFVNHNEKLKQDALYVGGSYIVTSATTYILKRAINRQRPFEKYTFIVKRIEESEGLSFPSGHTSAAFSIATAIALRYHKWYFIVPSYVFAASVGWGRMYQGVHYPSDVITGALVGAGSAWIGYKLQKWVSKRRAK